MSPKWRSRSDQPGKGKHYQVDEREPTRLPARAGLEPTERVASVKERSLGLDPRGTAQYFRANLRDSDGHIHDVYGVAFTDYGQTPDTEAVHIAHVQGMGDTKVANMKIFESGEAWYDEQYDPKHADERLKREIFSKKINNDEDYVKGKITEKTWRAKHNQLQRITAPKTEEVLAEMEQRSMEQGRPTDENQRYNGWSNHDTWNTKLLLDNTQETDRWQHDWGKNWLRKIKAGKFDPEKAELVVSKYLVPTARGKNKRFAGPDFTPDPDIDPKKVNKAEIVHSIISEEAEEEKYKASHKEG